jgi:restriction system protein
MLPALNQLADGQLCSVANLRERLASYLGLTAEDTAEVFAQSGRPVFPHRLYWAKQYLERAGAVESPGRGFVRITERGQQLLAENPPRIDRRILLRFPEFATWVKGGADSDQPTEAEVQLPVQLETSPDETMEKAHREMRKAVESEILDSIMAASPQFLERVVVDLLVALGYGGAGDSGKHLGRSGDGGVDGVIWEDKLGLDLIYVQAKRWQNTVGRPEIQASSGSLDGFRARKGVFITTSTFTREARDYVGSIEKKIVLIDGHELARLLFDTELGVSTERTYAVKRLDSDYFAEDF